jgi:PAS domain S-box-containing protein
MSGASRPIDGAGIAAASMDGVGVIEESEYGFANERLAGIHGVDAAEALVGREWTELYEPTDRGRTAGDLLDRVDAEGDWRGVAEARRRDGTRVPVDLSLRTIEGGVACVVREHTEANGAGVERRFVENLLDALDDVLYVVDGDDTLIEWNDRLTERLGYGDGELADASLRDLLPEESDGLGGDGRRLVELPSRAREVSLVTKAGERIPHELRGVTYTDESTGERYRVGIARDVTERRERERELERYETIVETVDDGVYALDEEFRISLANERLVEMLGQFGHDRGEILGSDAHGLLLHDEERAAVETVRERALAGETPTGTFEARTESPDGDPVVLEARFRLHPEPDDEYRGCVGVVRDVTERLERERQLERQRDELETLNRITELLLAVTRELFAATPSGTIEGTVCSRLVASDLYQLAWLGKPELEGDELVPHASAGADDDADAVAVPTDDGTELGPAGRAFRTGEIQVGEDVSADRTFEPWDELAVDRGVSSVAAVPLGYDGTTYGVLAVHTSRPLAFSRRERRGFEILGEAIGFVLKAHKTSQLLHAESITELEFELVEPQSVLVWAATELGCSLSLDSYVATGEGDWLLYLTVADDDGRFVDLAAADDRVRTVEPIDGDGGGTGRVVGLTVESSLLDAIAAVGGKVTAVTIGPGEGRVSVEIPGSTDVRTLVNQVRTIHPDATFAARTERERPVTTDTWLAEDREPSLTARQRQALEAAYRAGYYEWPRDSTAEEVADLLGIARPTLHAHLRKAERALLSAFLDAADAGDPGGAGTWRGE